MGQQNERWLPGHEVRKVYHSFIDDLAGEISSYVQNHTLAVLEFNLASEADVPCKIAEYSVEQRSIARIAARYRGSAIMRYFLQFRDVVVYGSMDPFSFEEMRKQRRKKLEKKDKTKSFSDKDVCL